MAPSIETSRLLGPQPVTTLLGALAILVCETRPYVVIIGNIIARTNSEIRQYLPYTRRYYFFIRGFQIFAGLADIVFNFDHIC